MKSHFTKGVDIPNNRVKGYLYLLVNKFFSTELNRYVTHYSGA